MIKYINILCTLLFLLFPKLLLSQSINDLNKLRDQYQKSQNNQLNDSGVVKNEISTNNPTEAVILPFNQSGILDENSFLNRREKIHFGYDFFNNRDSIRFWENLSIPNDYTLGPGDEVIISLWGETQLRVSYTISRDGKIYDEKVGILNLADKSLIKAKEYLKSQYSRVYSTLEGKSPSTFIDVSIGELKSINVNFVGKVNYPGIYPIHPFSNIITGLIQIGGIDTTGTLREIYIRRNMAEIIKIDFYEYFVNGKIPENVQLYDQDVVVVPPRESYVSIDSAVVSPGIYESKISDSVYDLIQYAGGPSYFSSNTAMIKKIVKSNQNKPDKPIYEISYKKVDSTKSINSKNVSEILIMKLYKEISEVELIGQVKSPGFYNFYEGMTFKELIQIGGGFQDSTYLKSVFKQKAQIIRRNPSTRYQRTLTVGLDNFFDNNDFIDIPLENLDKVIIYPNLNFFESENVKVLGEVNIPGDYPLTFNNESLQSLINRAGGFTNKSFKDGIEIYRDSTRVAWRNFSLPLMPGDSIVVKEKPGTILIKGEVYNPGLIEFNSSFSMKDYIDLAGGITKLGDNNDVIVIYANGEVVPKKRFKRTKIYEGATIVVNSKDLTDQFNTTEFANNTISILSSLATLILLTQQLSN